MDTKGTTRFLKTSEVARFLGTDIGTVKRLMAGGRLKGIRVGQRYKVLLESLFTFLSDQLGEEEALRLLREGGLLREEAERPQKRKGRRRAGPSKGGSDVPNKAYLE